MEAARPAAVTKLAAAYLRSCSQTGETNEVYMEINVHWRNEGYLTK